MAVLSIVGLASMFDNVPTESGLPKLYVNTKYTK